MMFVDSGAFIARFVRQDQHRPDAVAAWQQIARRATPLVTTNVVLIEVLDFLARDYGGDRVAWWSTAMRSIPMLSVVEVDAEDFEVATRWAAKFADQAFSFTDCVSFAVMSRLKSRRVFTFDHHFAIAGWQMWPQR